MEKTQSIKDIISKAVLVVGIFLFIGVMFQSVRDGIGQVMDVIMSPVLLLVGESNFFLLLSAMAIITAIYSSLIQKYLVDQNQMRDFQERMKVYQRDMKEAQKTQNTYLLKKLEEQQAGMMEEQMNMMKQQFKPMFYIVIISLPLLMWAYYYIGGHPDATLVFPFWGTQFLSDKLFIFTYWLYWYILSSFAFSQVLRKFMNITTAGA
ncbi:DUF106 domain-containing protein [Methanolapillus ohkumae]|uniref:DUF106 domain-containing protein n=1 Tax=Methanolapillus ohkumae TaxID=3028298 RepID=A0AA96V6J2_9EURY|nr:hypothetical protein MsAm2_01760 [Methanosarcinaceae archaeon Am2]